jgi:hypothetical protein
MINVAQAFEDDTIQKAFFKHLHYVSLAACRSMDKWVLNRSA